MLALEGATAAFAFDCHGKKKNSISLQQKIQRWPCSLSSGAFAL
jgi:hypothetical protein